MMIDQPSYDYDRISLYVEIWNKSDKEIHFSWATETHLGLKDNIGTSYKLTNRYIPGSDNETILPQERSDLNPGLAKATAEYLASPMFENGVTELHHFEQNFPTKMHPKPLRPINSSA